MLETTQLGPLLKKERVELSAPENNLNHQINLFLKITNFSLTSNYLPPICRRPTTLFFDFILPNSKVTQNQKPQTRWKGEIWRKGDYRWRTPRRKNNSLSSSIATSGNITPKSYPWPGKNHSHQTIGSGGNRPLELPLGRRLARLSQAPEVIWKKSKFYIFTFL